jgi:hypothetical protein
MTGASGFSSTYREDGEDMRSSPASLSCSDDFEIGPGNVRQNLAQNLVTAPSLKASRP